MTQDSIIKRCAQKGLRMTEQRKTIAKVLEESSDHPDVEQLHSRAMEIDPAISMATVYRTVKLFDESGILKKREFIGRKAGYEIADRDHHDHLLDLESGKVIEFVDPEIEALQKRIAEKLGYRLVGHRLELHGVPIKQKKKEG